MGFALAEQFALLGAHVDLITGPVTLETPHPSINRINVNTAIEMFEEAKKYFKKADITIATAAVADYRPATTHTEKIKKNEKELTIKLIKNPDIAKHLGSVKSKKQILVGFALETSDGFNEAKKKLKEKNFDLIVLNSLQNKGAGFKTDTNKISLIDKHNNIINFELKTKKEVAIDIIQAILKIA
jgi:phosphopantothenoylcysteine decarboxylase / phosphopantothenate---cysteine ligase